MKELWYLNKYLIEYKWHLILGVVFIALATGLHIFPAQMVRYAIDLIVDNIKTYQSLTEKTAQQGLYSVFNRQILIYVLLILGMALSRGLFLYLTRQTIIVMSRLIEYDLKAEIFEHYQVLPQSFHKNNSTGDMMNRVSEDVGRVRMYLGPCIMYGMQLAVLFLMIIPIMLTINLKLTLYALVPLPILSLSIYLVHSMIERQSEVIQESQSQLSTLVQEAFSGIRVLKSFAREEESVYNFSAENNEYMNRSLKLTWIQSLFFPLMTGIIGLSSVLVVYAGSVGVIEGVLTFGNIAEFVIYVNLLTWPVISLGWISSMVQRAEASQKRINEFLQTPSVPNTERGKRHTIRGKVEFDNVSFVYPDTGISAIENVSFTVFPGEKLAIIGATGAGKSTIVDLIAGLYDVTEGEIRIDDVPLQKYHMGSMRRQMGFVPQDAFLFSDTIHNNIAFGLSSQETDQVAQYAKYADVYDNIMEFPKGFDTRVGERGVTLSGGQKQRISIARAIIRKPAILVLDDALSAVDVKTENTILKNIDAIMTGRTCITVSHRIASSMLADKIVVLQDGRIVEKGTHDTLLAKRGVYSNLYSMQMQEQQGVG